MARCFRCNKFMLFGSNSGYCKECDIIVQQEERECRLAEEEQKRRIMARNGAEGLKVFLERWIPMEEQYFRTYMIRERCDYLITL